MEMRPFGRSGRQFLGSGLPRGGRLMVRGDPLDRQHAIAQALTAFVAWERPAGLKNALEDHGSATASIRIKCGFEH
jgi:hypothetical protein